MGRAHSAAAAARNGLDHQGIADLFRDLHRVFVGLDHAVTSRRDRHAGSPSAGARQIFVAHFLNHVRRRPDELDLAALNHFGEVRVLGQKTVAGMNRVDVAHFRGAHDSVDL